MEIKKAEFITSMAQYGQFEGVGLPQIAVAGKSNVGKSSLINKLCNRKKLARVSATPGKTATINFYRVDTAYFVDLPGYGYAKVSNAERERWDDLINSYFVPSACLSSCWTAATRPALTMCRCLSTCTTTAFRLWPR